MGGGLQTGTSSGQNDRVPFGFGNLYVSAGDHIGHFYRTDEEAMSVLVSSLTESSIVVEEGSELALIPETEKQRRERENLLTALQRSNWKMGGKGGAAELLGVKPTTLHSRIKKIEIKRPG